MISNMFIVLMCVTTSICILLLIIVWIVQVKRNPTASRQKVHLDVYGLNEVIKLLVKYGYSGTSYYHLGLALGLVAPTLDIIEKNNVGNVTGCLQKCLSAWLRKSDNVEGDGHPSWYTLIAALRSIGEHAVAEGIDREKHPACVIVSDHRHKLSLHDLLPLPMLLHKEGITKEISPATGGTDGLLTAVREAVCVNHENLEKFAVILQLFPATASVGNDILKDYRKAFSNNSTDGSALDREERGELHVLEIHIPRSLNPDFRTIRAKFASTVQKVNDALTVPVDKLKSYYQLGYNKYLNPQLDSCQTTLSVLRVICEKCTLTNISLLEGVVNHFEIAEAKAVIQQYKESIKEFCQVVPLRLSLDEKLSPPSPLQCQTATFLVDRRVDDCTLSDIEDLIIFAFEQLAPNVNVVVVRKSNSFTITCSFPLILSESLIATALHNLDLLVQKKGLLQLTIGYSTVYSSTTHDEAIMISDNKEAPIMNSIELSEWVTAVYTSRGTLEQLLVSQTVQHALDKEEIGQLLKEREKYIESLNTSESELREKQTRVMKLEIEQLQSSLQTKAGLEETLVESKGEIELLQEKISLLSVQLKEREEQNQQLDIQKRYSDHDHGKLSVTAAAGEQQRNVQVSYHPTKRRSHSTHIIGDFMYLWGGFDEEPDLNKMDTFNLLKGTWKHKKTRGIPPLGARGYCSAVIGNNIYYFGGYFAMESENTFHNSLSRYNTSENKWEELLPSQDREHPSQCPMRKEASKMVVYTTEDGKKYLVVIGGCGPRPLIAEDDEIASKLFTTTGTSIVRTNEQHYFIITEGVWVKPATAGTRPPPCDSFTLTQLDDKRALLFGGGPIRHMSNSIYIAKFSPTQITWELALPKPGILPDSRFGHSAALLCSCHHKNHIIIVGGYYRYILMSIPCNIWLYNHEMESWTELTLPDDSIVNKHYQSMSVWEVTPDTVWLILYGGRPRFGCDYSNDMTFIELIYNGLTWKVGKVLHAPLDSNYEEALAERRKQDDEWAQHSSYLSLNKLELQDTLQTQNVALAQETKGNKKLENENTTLNELVQPFVKETDKVKDFVEEIQILKAQVNAYSREGDELKRALTESQERYKTLETEAGELKRSLTQSHERYKTLETEAIELKRALIQTQDMNKSLVTEKKSIETGAIEFAQQQCKRMRNTSEALQVKIKVSNRKLQDYSYMHYEASSVK